MNGWKGRTPYEGDLKQHNGAILRKKEYLRGFSVTTTILRGTIQKEKSEGNKINLSPTWMLQPLSMVHCICEVIQYCTLLKILMYSSRDKNLLQILLEQESTVLISTYLMTGIFKYSTVQ